MLPAGYKQIEYVQSNGTGSYFKTGILPTANTRVVFDGYVVSGDTALYGSRFATSNNRYAVQYIGTNQYRLSYDSTEALAPASYSKGVRYVFDQRNNELYIDDVLAASVKATPTYPNAREIYAVGALNTNNAASNFGVVRMYSMKVYQDGALAGDFVPVQDAEGNIGIYNLVSDTFFRNAGSGSVAGGAVLKEVTGIKITTQPDKVEYLYGEELDLSGMVVTAVYEDGTSDTISEYTVTGYRTDVLGEQTVTVSYHGYAADFTVMVANYMASLAVTPPSRTQYDVGETIDTAGMEVRVIWADGTEEAVIGWTMDAIAYTPGANTVTVHYEGLATAFEITVMGSFTVTFVDWNGTVLDTQTVQYGQPALAPDYPDREGYCFTGWDKDFLEVTSNMTVTAVYDTWEYADGILAVYAAFDWDTYDDIYGYPWSAQIYNITKAVFKEGIHKIGFCALPGSAISEVVIPDSVTNIAETAFSGCENLQFVTLPCGLKSIGRSAFENSGLVRIVLPDRITSIGNYAFSYTFITEILIPAGIDNMGDDIFSGCFNLLSAVFQDGVTRITGGIFRNCSALARVTVPDSVTVVESSAFVSCSSLQEIVFPEGITEIGWNVFAGSGLTHFTIPSTVETIAAYAFYGCSGLKEIVIPQGVCEIGHASFSGCTALTGIYLYNRDTIIKEISGSETIYSAATIYGYAGSTAQDYAESHGNAFVYLDADSTVTFVDWNGEVLSEQVVAYGANAKSPEDPAREGYFFLGWDKDFSAVTGDLTVAAVYDPAAMLTLSPPELNLIETKSADITAILLPENLSEKEVAWSNSVPEVAAYNSVSGKINALSPGMTVITATHVSQGVSASCQVKVLTDTIDSLVITSLPDKTEYYVGEVLDTAGLAVTAIYASGKEEVLDSGYTVSGYDGTSAGAKTVTVTYSAKSAAFEVNVKEDLVVLLEVLSMPDKAEYEIGQTIDLTGMVVTATFESGKKASVTGYTVSEFDSSTAGTKTITVSYGGKAASFSVEVLASRVTAIKIAMLPDKLSYLVGDKLDLAGMVVMATLTSGEQAEFNDYVVSGFDSRVAAEQTVTVSYGEAEDTFTVLVRGVRGIALVRSPEKTRYVVGEGFDCTGMQVIAQCTDGTEVNCTADVSVSLYNEGIHEAPAAWAHFKGHDAEIPVCVDRAYIGTPVREDILLTYDFESNSCIIMGNGFLNPVGYVLESYQEKVTKMEIGGVSSLQVGFFGCFLALEEVVITAPLERLPNGAMKGLRKLRDVRLPETLKRIDFMAFQDTTALEQIVLPDAVEQIDASAFENTGIQEIILPAELRVLDTGVFQNCTELQKVIFNDRLEIVGNSVFSGCSMLRNLIFPDSVTEINTSIYNLDTLDYVRYPAGMTTISAPRGTNARTIVIPDGVTEIISGAFGGFGRIENVFLPGTLELISTGAFQGCTALRSISISESVKTVDNGAFQDSGLEEIFFYGRNTAVGLYANIPRTAAIHGYRGSSAEAYCTQFGNTFIPFDDYEFTREIKDLYDTDSTHKRVVIHFPNWEAADIENDRIYLESMSLTESICDEENLVFGGCNASKFEIQVADVDEDIRGAVIEVKQYIGDKYVPLFMGVIDSADRQDNRRFKKIIAYDRMYADGARDVTEWLKSLTFPMSILDLRGKVCEKLGFIQTAEVLVNDYIVLSRLSVQDGITGREVLRAICEFNGVFGYITRMGFFDYISLDRYSEAFNVTGYRKVKYEEYTVRGIESLSVRGSSGATVLTLGAGNKYVLRDNFIVYGLAAATLQEAAANLLAKIQGISYRSFSGEGRGLPYIFLGRRVQYAVNGSHSGRTAEIVDSYVLKRTMTGIQALRDIYAASGEEYQPDIPASVSTSETARQLEDYVSEDDLDGELESMFEEFTQGEQYQYDIEQAVRNVLLNGGYYKIVSVPSLPAAPASDTVYLIQGEVTVS